MKILVISDVHANFCALRAVIEREKADQIWCLGDLVDYGPDPAEVVTWVRENVSHCVRGNHDHAMAFGVSCGCSEKFRDLSETSREMNRKLLLSEHLDYLRLLPIVRKVSVNGKRFHLAHAAPSGDLYRYLRPDTSDVELAAQMIGIEADYVFCGHTHQQMVRKIGNAIFVNPGSVGQQRDGNPSAGYAVWHDGEIRLERVPYDVAKTVEALRGRPLPEPAIKRLTAILETGHDVS